MPPAISEPLVWAIILNYNGDKVLADCLRSLVNQDYPNLHSLVIDNASTDNSPALVKDFPKVELHINEKNLLFAGGNNVGIKMAIDAGAEYIVLINNDTIFNPDLITHMLSTLKADNKTGIAGPMIYYHDPPDIIWSAGGLVDFTRGWVRHRGIRHRDTGQFNEIARVDYVTGCCLMFNRAVYSAIGGLDEYFPMYYEDTDFCTRARKAGFDVLFVPDAKMWHKISFSSGGEFSSRKIIRRAKAGWRFFIRHSSAGQLILMPFWQVLEFLRVVLMLIRRKFAGS